MEDYTDLSGSQQRIVRAMKTLGGESTGSDIAKAAKISAASFYNHKEDLINKGIIEPVVNYKTGRGYLFRLVSERTVGYSVIHNNERQTLFSFLEKLALKGAPKNPAELNIYLAIYRLFKMAAMQLSDEPVMIRAIDLKEIQSNLVSTAEHLESLAELARAILDRNRLWDRNELPTALIMEHQGLDIEEVFSIIDRIENGQTEA